MSRNPVRDRTTEDTDRSLGPDADAYRRLLGPLVGRWREISPALQGPLALPRHPFALARFGVLAIRPATMLARSVFEGEKARALRARLEIPTVMVCGHSPSTVR